MKILKRHLEKDGSGFIKVQPEEDEDLWHLYHLIALGDIVEATTVRKVTRESSTGSVSSEKVRLNLKIEIDNIDFDPKAGTLRLKGINQTESQHIRMGASHTLSLEAHRNVTLHKLNWDAISLKRLKDAADPSTSADAAAIVLDEGVAHVCLLKPNMVITVASINVSVPRKRRGSTTQHEKGMQKFFEQILNAIEMNLRFDVVKAVLVASPGFIRETFLTWLWAECIKRDNKKLLEQKSKFVAIHCTSGHRHALNEILATEAAINLLADTKAAEETQTMVQFDELLRNDPGRAFYGFNHCVYANEKNAIETLMITDELFRAANVQQRKKYVNFMEECKQNGAKVLIYSSLHVTGEKLQQLTGIAAILRYPLDDPDDSDSDSSEIEGIVTPRKPKSNNNDDDESDHEIDAADYV